MEIALTTMVWGVELLSDWQKKNRLDGNLIKIVLILWQKYFSPYFFIMLFILWTLSGPASGSEAIIHLFSTTFYLYNAPSWSSTSNVAKEKLCLCGLQ